MSKSVFEEVQRFNQPWLLLVLFIPVVVFIWGFVQQIIMKVPFGNNPAPDWFFLILFAFLGGLIFLFFKMRLITRIDKSGIAYRFTPFYNKEKMINWSEVSRVEVTRYNPLKEYGGWGIRYGRKGKALNVRGNYGMMIEFHGGKNLLIGTQKPEELQRTLHALGKSATSGFDK